MLQKWSNIHFSNSQYSPAIYEKPSFLTFFEGFVAYGTPCSQSFQDKWVILYIFEKPTSRAFQKMSLEVIWRNQAQATGENVQKNMIKLLKKPVMNSHIIKVKTSNILEKPLYTEKLHYFTKFFRTKKLKSAERSNHNFASNNA